MAVKQGVRGTAVLDTETRRVRDVSPAIAQLEPDAGPLVTMLMKLKSRATTDAKIEWFEDELLPRFDVLGGDLGASASSMTVTNYKYFRSGDLVRVNKAEIIKVTATPSSVSVDIARSAGSTSAQSASSGDQLHLLSNSNQEGAGSRSLLSTVRVPKYNHCQIMRHPFGYTNTARATKQFAGQDEDEEKSKQLIEHKKDIELAFILGELGKIATGTHPERMTAGMNSFIKTNVKAMSGTMTEDEFGDFLRLCFRYGSREKLVLCSPKLIQVINGFAHGKLQTRSDDKTYGITLTRYQSAGRVVELAEHVLLTNDSLSDLSGIAGYGYLVDIGDLAIRYMQGRFTILKENIQANDEDKREDEYLSEVGLELKQEKKHGKLTGVTD